MHMDNEILRFIILSETSTREPLYVLLRTLHKFSCQEMQSFFSVLIDLVEEDMLHCDYWSRDDQKHHSIKTGLSGKLQEYVSERSQKNQTLTETPEGMPLLEFIRTEKGEDWVNQRYHKVESIGFEYIKKIEAFKKAESKYPTSLYELYPNYIAKIEEPSDIYGSWWYSVNSKGDFFYFGYFAYSGTLVVYDKENKEWVEF